MGKPGLAPKTSRPSSKALGRLVGGPERGPPPTLLSPGGGPFQIGYQGDKMQTDGPMAGVQVVEWAHAHMGPGAGMFLADMGADVVHVEQPVVGNSMRRFATLW